MVLQVVGVALRSLRYGGVADSLQQVSKKRFEGGGC